MKDNWYIGLKRFSAFVSFLIGRIYLYVDYSSKSQTLFSFCLVSNVLPSPSYLLSLLVSNAFQLLSRF